MSDSDAITSQLPKVLLDSTHACTYIQQSSRQLIKLLQGTSSVDHATISPWIADAQKLASFKLEPKKLVVLGRTGAGKSTAISALCGQPILATGADAIFTWVMHDLSLTWIYSACTSAPTEVIYEDIGNALCRATVTFLSRGLVKAPIQLDCGLVSLFTPYETALICILRRSPADESSSSGSRQDAGPAKVAWETLCQIYPHLRKLSTSSRSGIQLEDLFSDEQTCGVLDTERSLGPCTSVELEDQLRAYVTSHASSPDVPAYWHLVDIVRIYGKFDALASGTVILVDVPGYGDANETRTARTQEYLNTADQIVIVADIKRAVDDATTREYLRTFIHRLIGIDGRQGSLTMFLTGADTPITSKQVHHLSNKQRCLIEGWEKEEKELMEKQNAAQSIKDLLSNLLESDPTDTLTLQEVRNDIWNVSVEIETASTMLKNVTFEKNAYVANQRSKSVSNGLQRLYQSIYKSIAGPQSKKAECSRLPIFCLGSADFLRLAGIEQLQPQVFRHVDATGIPRLRQHIINTGHRQAYTLVQAQLSNTRALLSEVQSFYLSCQKSDRRLAKFEKFAAATYRELRAQCEVAVDATLMIIHNEIAELKESLNEAGLESANASFSVVTDFGENTKFNTYNAIMRRQGEWRNINLNLDLVHDMFNQDVANRWNSLFNESIKSQLRLLVSKIDMLFKDAIRTIVNRAMSLKTIKTQIKDASENIDARSSLDAARTEFMKYTSTMQRSFGGGFGGIIAQELSEHYKSVADQRGKGMFQRMKVGYVLLYADATILQDINAKQFERNTARILYHAVVDYIMRTINTAVADGEQCFDEALNRLYISFHRSLVCVQGNSVLEKLQKRRKFPEMLAFIQRCTVEGDAIAKTVGDYLDLHTVAVE
ncbi:hypothetical protein BJ138DRAFT_1108455 [Hygrophoropsis aurantiaca]|uniref:Uncharacterized protein n=1 Tax=Hygrophoropsis aurantiaca TaxID=72124 RepID=A0ACB8AV47_9AGAM|nr:hypothetical protein BJ138DRAFT_1108455 [Hygrophoropsis aurantiaca]